MADEMNREREAVARAIWALMREHEDRCDQELEDLEPSHPIWAYADAARASLAASAGSEPVAWRYVDARGHFRYVGYKPSRDMAAEYPLLKPIRLYLHPSPPEGAGWRQGVEAAAALLSKKADDFAREHGYDDMGSLSFGRGSHADAKLDYHSSLLELEEEVRAMTIDPGQVVESGSRVLMEHSGCGRGTQVDTLTVRLNPGDKVILWPGPVTRAMIAAAPPASEAKGA